MREPVRPQPVDELPHGDARLRIEAGRGLVEEEQARAVHDRARDHQAPPVPAGERLRPLARVRAQLEAVEELVDPGAEADRARPEVLGGDQQVLLDA